MSIAERIGWALLAALCAWGAVLQLNDPDPVPWFAIYAVSALVCGGLAAQRAPGRLPLLVAAIAIIWSLLLAPQVLGKVPFAAMFGDWEMKDPGVELERETYGLWLLALFNLAAWWRGRRLSPAALPANTEG